MRKKEKKNLKKEDTEKSKMKEETHEEQNEGEIVEVKPAVEEATKEAKEEHEEENLEEVPPQGFELGVSLGSSNAPVEKKPKNLEAAIEEEHLEVEEEKEQYEEMKYGLPEPTPEEETEVEGDLYSVGQESGDLYNLGGDERSGSLYDVSNGGDIYQGAPNEAYAGANAAIYSEAGGNGGGFYDAGGNKSDQREVGWVHGARSSALEQKSKKAKVQRMHYDDRGKKKAA